MTDYFIAIVPILISAVSLIISIKAIRQQAPHLRISLLNPRDAFYGATQIREEAGQKILSSYVAGVRFRIYNGSSAPLTIAEITLQANGERYDMADVRNEHWSEIIFYFSDKYGTDIDSSGFTTDGSYIDYKSSGVSLPFEMNPYQTKDITAIFYHFPKLSHEQIKSRLIIDTAHGKRSKKILLYRYDADYYGREWEDIEKFQKSL